MPSNKQPKTVEALTAEIAEVEQQRTDLRNRQRDLVLRLANAKDEEDRKQVQAYWDEQVKKDPDAPDVLRARAAMIDAANAEGQVVTAATALLEAKGNN